MLSQRHLLQTIAVKLKAESDVQFRYGKFHAAETLTLIAALLEEIAENPGAIQNAPDAKVLPFSKPKTVSE